MDDLNRKISELLSDPQALEQIKGLGEMLGISDTSQNAVHKEQNEQKEQKQSDMIAPFSGSNSPDMLNMLTKFAPLMSNLQKEDDTTRLLSALRPFLSEERRKKLDEAGKLIKIMRLLPLIKDFGILDSLF